MTIEHSRIPPRLHDELVVWINSRSFTHFVTLAPNNDHELCGNIVGLHQLIKRWDAYMNRELLGSKWAKPIYRSDRMFAFYFLEKLHVRPHWHGLIRVDEADPDKRAKKLEKLEKRTDEKWKELIRTGSTDVQVIPSGEKENVVDYVAKELRSPVLYEHFIVPDMFDALR